MWPPFYNKEIPQRESARRKPSARSSPLLVWPTIWAIRLSATAESAPYAAFLPRGGKSKFGFFQSEAADFRRIADELGLPSCAASDESLRFARHPLVYLVEAADDICYQIMDLEDAHKLRLLSDEQAEALLLDFFAPEERERLRSAYPMVTDANDRMVYYRSSIINALERACVNIFVDNETAILAGTFEGSLISHLPEPLLGAYQRCAALAKEKIYRSKEVMDVDLAGYHIIYTLLELMTEAVLAPQKAYSQMLLGMASKQYELKAERLEVRLMAVLDYLSGMTDVYALDLYRKISGQSLPMV